MNLMSMLNPGQSNDFLISVTEVVQVAALKCALRILIDLLFLFIADVKYIRNRLSIYGE